MNEMTIGATPPGRAGRWPRADGRYGYLFEHAEAESRLGMAPALAALAEASAPGLAAWRARMAGGDSSGGPDPRALRWIAGRFAAWLSAPHAVRQAEDEAEVLPAGAGPAGLAPLDPARVVADLVNRAPGLPDRQAPARRAALHGLLHALCTPRVLAETARLGAPLHAAMVRRCGPGTVALETAVALGGVIDPARPLGEVLAASYRLSLPTAQGARVALAQSSARLGLAALPPAPTEAVGPDARAVLVRHGFDRRTPLAVALVHEAQDGLWRGAARRDDGSHAGGHGGGRLGPLGSRLLAEAVLGAEHAAPAGAAEPGLCLIPADAAFRALEALWQTQEAAGGGD